MASIVAVHNQNGRERRDERRHLRRPAASRSVMVVQSASSS
jgi:hypothetical protein